MTSSFIPTGFVEEQPTTEHRFSNWLDRGYNVWWLLWGLWLIYTIYSISMNWDRVAGLSFIDVDDAMRLIQVRDFLAGQSWFDVSQHRLNPPYGGPMHWSRLVDLPIAGLIIVLRPLFGPAMAEGLACAIIPMVTFGGIGFGLFAGIRGLIGTKLAAFSTILLATSPPIILQTTPLRIDHHAWQIAMAVGLIGGMLHPNPRKGGWIMGAAIMLWLHISSEGIPYAAMAGAILTLRYAIQPSEWARLIRYVAMLTVGSTALLIATHGIIASLASYCDAISPVYLAPLWLLFIALLSGHKLIRPDSLIRRILPATIGGAGAALLFLKTGGPCLAGPFEMLDPLVYKYWYLNVLEGQPLWKQSPQMIGASIVPELVGLSGLCLAFLIESKEVNQKSESSEIVVTRHINWASLLLFGIGSFAIAIMVLRAISVSHMVAIIGSAWLIGYLWPTIAKLPRAMLRVPLSVALLLLTPMGAASVGISIANIASPKTIKDSSKASSARDSMNNQLAIAMRSIPPSTVFAPLDIGPLILLRSPNSVIATGHHRNANGMKTVVRSFIAPPDEARRIIETTPATYLFVINDLSEMRVYKKAAPNGLAARLMEGTPPAWLQPIRLPGLGQAKLYKINRSIAQKPHNSAH